MEIAWDETGCMDEREWHADPVCFTHPRTSSDRNSATTMATSTAGTPKIPTPPRIEDLERRLNTDRALDIFTLQPKVCPVRFLE